MSPELSKIKELYRKAEYELCYKVLSEQYPEPEALHDDIKAEVLYWYSKIYLMINKYPLALEFGYKANFLLEKSGQIDLYVESFITIARSILLFQDYKNALEVALNGFVLCKANKLEHLYYDFYDAIGISYYYAGDSANALKYLPHSLEWAEKETDNIKLYTANNQLGTVYFGMAEYALAEKYYKTSFKYAYISGQPHTIAIVYNNLANIYSYLHKDKEKAIENYQYAIEFVHKSNSPQLLPEYIHNIAYLYMIFKEFDTAEKYFLEALELTQKHKIINLNFYIYGNLYEMYKQQGKLEQAMDCIIKYEEVREEVRENSYKRQVEYLSLIQRPDVLKLEAKLLTEQNEELSDLNNKLLQLNEEKNNYLRIASTDLAKPLYSIQLICSSIKNYSSLLDKESKIQKLDQLQSITATLQSTIQKLLSENKEHSENLS